MRTKSKRHWGNCGSKKKTKRTYSLPFENAWTRRAGRGARAHPIVQPTPSASAAHGLPGTAPDARPRRTKLGLHLEAAGFAAVRRWCDDRWPAMVAPPCCAGASIEEKAWS
jgi:hypothetical protein